MAEIISFRLSDQHRRKLASLAKAWNCSQSDVIRWLIENAKLDDVVRGDKSDSDVKRAKDRARLIAELQQLHEEALRRDAEKREAAKRGEKS